MKEENDSDISRLADDMLWSHLSHSAESKPKPLFTRPKNLSRWNGLDYFLIAVLFVSACAALFGYFGLTGGGRSVFSLQIFGFLYTGGIGVSVLAGGFLLLRILWREVKKMG